MFCILDMIEWVFFVYVIMPFLPTTLIFVHFLFILLFAFLFLSKGTLHLNLRKYNEMRQSRDLCELSFTVKGMNFAKITLCKILTFAIYY